MSLNRKNFLRTFGAAFGSVALGGIPSARSSEPQKKPIVLSTWEHGLDANDAAWKVLSNNGKALDAVEAGVRVTESDPENRSVGLGGNPDRDGNVTLDACIMDHTGNCGSVAFLQHIENPISVARKVMEETPHVMLVGEGALQFAEEQGFERKNLLTPGAEKAWKKWLKKSEYKPVINVENHDTIGMLAMDEEGNISGACTTSGAAYKLHGRVGDSPIIGAGLFVDNEVGGACATGLGEAVIRVSGSAMVVEQIRHGATPQEACELVLQRIINNEKNPEELQVGLLAIDKAGNVGAASIHKGFNFALHTGDTPNELVDAKYLLKKQK
ncbi:MAG TPA: glycosylasparaginase [Balneolaceae bacterium]|nr:glycosylasparaginase [Balneolaceae bacterium]|tara:strand:- start:213467 stop:214447 length:981 start_codon:yes stop_codon:yes gene_type:complete